MRFSLSPEFGKSTGNVLVAVFLASVVTGCSSDVMRFGGYSSGADQMTTSSIPSQDYSGGRPTPRADVASGLAQPGYAGGQQALNQPYPGQGYSNQGYPAQPSSGGYGYNSPGAMRSNARMATAPVSVQRSELAAPSPTQSRANEREQALAQPFPIERKAPPVRAVRAPSPDPITTGTT